jgi:hypothetical protein
LRSRNVGSNGFQVSGVANRVKGAWASFYSPQKESFCWGVRDPVMSSQGSRYVQKVLLELGRGTEHVRCRDLTRVKTRRADMSCPGTRYVLEMVLEPNDWARYARQEDLATVKIMLTRHVRCWSRTCTVMLTRAWQRTRISPVFWKD